MLQTMRVGNWPIREKSPMMFFVFSATKGVRESIHIIHTCLPMEIFIRKMPIHAFFDKNIKKIDPTDNSK